MPSRNIIRVDVADAFYHIYARGTNKQPIFIDYKDKQKFLDLFERYLSKTRAVSSTGEPYPHYRARVQLLAYCLMTNHFHLFLHQQNTGDMSAFMSSLMTSYVRYFNLRHRRRGSLFESRFKASHIYNDAYFLHVSRYIHLNPRSWKYFKYSSINYYRKGNEPNWLHTAGTLRNFSNRAGYMNFLYDYEDYKETLDEIKHELADN